MCEAILLKPELCDLREHVSEAKIFWSHMQCEPFLGEVLSDLGGVGLETRATADRTPTPSRATRTLLNLARSRTAAASAWKGSSCSSWT